jgi:hypothetical protein
VLRLPSLVCSAMTRAERRGCWARAAAQAQARGQSGGGGRRGHSGACGIDVQDAAGGTAAHGAAGMCLIQPVNMASADKALDATHT